MTGMAGAAPWQLVVEYTPAGLRITDAQPIAPMRKRAETPGLAGAPVKLNYSASWRGAKGEALAQTSLTLPLGLRAALQPGLPCEEVVPSAGVAVLRVEGPERGVVPKQLVLSARARKLPKNGAQTLGWASQTSLTLEVPGPAGRAKMGPGPVGVEKIRDTGPDDNRLVLVILGEGFTQAELDANEFRTAAEDLVSNFSQDDPWNALGRGTNFYRIDVASNESGADRTVDSSSPLVDTWFNATFWTSGIERLLGIDGIGFNRGITAANTYVGAGKWDFLIYLVNTTKYGGAGGSYTTVSRNSSALDVLIHETGHSFAGLADEYTSAYPGYPPGDGEANVDFDAVQANIKWRDWITTGTPLPTPDISAYNGVIGAFVGARYLTSGIHRPKRDCKMRSLGIPFCEICREEHVVRYFARASMLDGKTPPTAGTVDLTTGGPVTFTLETNPVDLYEYAWSVDGAALNGETGPGLTVAGDGYSSGLHTLRGEVRVMTPWVRKSIAPVTTTWQIRTAQVPTTLSWISLD